MPNYCTPGELNPDGCLYWSPDQIAFPYSGELNTLFITTKVAVYQSLPITSCDLIVPDEKICEVPTIEDLTSTKRVYYAAYVEYLTIMLDHK
jgi:hypothetical protein